MSVWGFCCCFQCHHFTHRFLPGFTILRLLLPLNWSVPSAEVQLPMSECFPSHPQGASSYDKSLGSVIKQIPGFVFLEFYLKVSALFVEHIYNSFSFECVGTTAVPVQLWDEFSSMRIVWQSKITLIIKVKPSLTSNRHL